MTGSASIIQANSVNLPIEDDSVDLIITSPPYFALRSYKDGDEHYDGQIGSEPTPKDFLEALWTVTKECQRVLKPTGSLFVNLGDKYTGSGGHNNASISTPGNKHAKPGAEYGERRNAPKAYNKSAEVAEGVSLRDQSLMGLPWRFAIGCTDRLGMVLRAELVWSKPNALPESVTNRVARTHEHWFHLTNKSTGYYTAIDEIREPYFCTGEPPIDADTRNPLGKLPGSVWEIATESLSIPDEVKKLYDLPDHFAAFPTEWPRRLINAFSPVGICLECGEGRRPYASPTSSFIEGYVCACTPFRDHEGTGESSGRTYAQGVAEGGYVSNDFGGRLADRPRVSGWREYLLDEWTPASTRPAVVVDVFGGTGTVAMVARELGRHGISIDMSAAYCRLANWRIFKSGHWRKARDKEAAKTLRGLF